VPAAAVIPAPIAYIKIVAVKKLVVGFLVLAHLARLGLQDCVLACAYHPSSDWLLPLLGRGHSSIFYFEKIRVFKAGLRYEYISME
jgi:hypothetical protein